MHTVLKSQLSRCLDPAGAVDLEKLSALVDRAYTQFDAERARSERANTLMIAEIAAADARRESILAALRLEHMKLDAALEHMVDGLAMFDPDQRLIVANKRYQRNMEALGASPDMTYTESVDLIRTLIASVDQPLEAIPGLMASGTPAERMVHMRDGRTIVIAFQPLKPGGWVQVMRDVTKQRRSEEHIRYLARHDSLTGLSNRVVFNEAIEREITRVRRGESLAVLCLDLDHFKAVNDTLGHPVGDQLLKVVADRLRSIIREGDIIARLGGDEFAILQIAGEQPTASERLAKEIVELLLKPYDIDGQQIVIGVSVGIAVAPADGHEAETLMRNADIALYRAKSDGRGVFRFFESGMDEAMQVRRRMELDLRQALLAGEFELFYQPLIDLRTQEIQSCEALIRWNHPTRGLVPPDSFIPLAEEIGLIVEIGEWVLMAACKEAVKWPSHIGVAVNVSPTQLVSRRMVNAVRRALAQSGLNPGRLELEITESVLLNETDRSLGILHELRALGVRIAMDDFGTGYSSLSYLRRFPFDKLKIDRSFIGDLGQTPEASAIVQAVIQLANTFGMSTTAEGVENIDQKDILKSLNCQEIQGFLVSRPVPSTRLPGLLSAPRPRKAVA